MHTGTLATIGYHNPKNFYHIIFNNGAHESVGGQPTVGLDVDFKKVAKGYLYENVRTVESNVDLYKALDELRNKFNLNKSNESKNSKIFIAYYLNEIRLIDNF